MKDGFTLGAGGVGSDSRAGDKVGGGGKEQDALGGAGDDERPEVDGEGVGAVHDCRSRRLCQGWSTKGFGYVEEKGVTLRFAEVEDNGMVGGGDYGQDLVEAYCHAQCEEVVGGRRRNSYQL